MNGFDFGMTAGASQSSARKQLAGNNIYEVTFDGCEARDIQGVQDPTKTFKVLDIKFSNDEGTFTDTTWEFREEDFNRTQGQYGEQPSNVETFMMKIKHLIDAVNPALAEKINKKETSIKAPTWDALRQVIVKATDPGKGTKTHIKLLTKKNTKSGMDEPVFPRYFVHIYDGVPRLTNNFIGDKLVFTANEQKRISDLTNAKPKAVEVFPSVTDNVMSNYNRGTLSESVALGMPGAFRSNVKSDVINQPTDPADTFDMPF